MFAEMPPPKTVLKFGGKLFLLWVILLAPWPGIESGYAAVFRALGNLSFQRFWMWGDGTVRFCNGENIASCKLPSWAEAIAPPPHKERDTILALENRQVRGTISFLRTSSRIIGYWPLVGFIGLVLATPAPWKRLLKAMGIGLLVVHAFILLRLTVYLALDGFSGNQAVALFQPGPTMTKFLGYARVVLSDDPVVSFVAPAVIWVFLLFRPSQWAGSAEAEEPTNVPGAAH